MALTADGWPRPVSAVTISDSPKLVIAGEQFGARLTTKIQLFEQNVTPYKGTTFLLLPVSFIPVLKLSRPCIHTSEWVQYSSPGLFFLCESKCGYLFILISFSENSFLLVLFLMQIHCCVSITWYQSTQSLN